MNKKLLISGVLMGLTIIGSISFTNHYTYAEQIKHLEDYNKVAGEYVKNNPELLKNSIDTLENKVLTDDIVTNVNSLPISISEIKFRQGLRQASGIGDTDYKSVFNTLVEEKLIFNYAIENNVLATDNEVNSFLESEKQSFNENEEVQKAINEFIQAANMSLEDYWNTYEYYNAFRIVTFKNAYDHAIEVGLKKGDVKPLESKDPLEIIQTTKEHEDYWKNIKKEMKIKTSLIVTPKYLNQNSTLDNSKLYLGGE